MEILYQYAKEYKESCNHTWSTLGIDQCLLKYISYDRDGYRVTKKRHYHMHIEVHIVERGCQIYRFDGEEVRVESGSFLWISPEVAHVAVEEDPLTVKYAVCLHVEEGSALCSALARVGAYVVGKTPAALWEHMKAVREEMAHREICYDTVVGNRLFESVVCLLRTVASGLAAERAEPVEREDHRLTLAKQYVEDNIERSISLPELAAYCHISEKQLTRVFRRGEGMGVAEYIRQKRCRRIERLLAETHLSLYEISERMGFSSEYYFNAFYKKYAGMTPGAYRRSVSGQ